MQKRYVISLHARFIQQLIKWEKEANRIDIREYFQCICGKNKWILLLPFDKTEKQNPVPCNCQFDDQADCPNLGCTALCEEMTDRHPGEFRDSYLKWGYTLKDNLQGEFDLTEVPLSRFPPAHSHSSRNTVLFLLAGSQWSPRTGRSTAVATVSC